MKSVIFGLLLAITFVQPLYALDEVILFDENDPEMNSAISQTRDTLDSFLLHTRTNHIHPDDVMLKVAFPRKHREGREGREHIWVSPFSQSATGFTGYLVNEPVDLGDIELGSPVFFTREMISDWMVFRDGVGYGSFTTRVILGRMPEEQAESIRSQLSDIPLLDEWK